MVISINHNRTVVDSKHEMNLCLPEKIVLTRFNVQVNFAVLFAKY